MLEILRFEIKIKCEFFNGIARIANIKSHISYNLKIIEKVRFNFKFISECLTWDKFQMMTINMGLRN